VSFTTVPSFIDVRTFAWKNYAVVLGLTYVIDLEKSIEQIWSGFSRTAKKGIKHVSALSPQIRHTNDVSLVIGLRRERFNELGIGVPLFSDCYLKELAAAFPQRVTVHSVSIDGRIASAEACCVLREDRYARWIGGVNARRDLKTNEFLMWEVIQHAKSEGFKTLEVIGANQPRLNVFKSKFDPALEPYCAVDKTDALGNIAFFVKKRILNGRILRRRNGRDSNDRRS